MRKATQGRRQLKALAGQFLRGSGEAGKPLPFLYPFFTALRVWDGKPLIGANGTDWHEMALFGTEKHGGAEPRLRRTPWYAAVRQKLRFRGGILCSEFPVAWAGQGLTTDARRFARMKDRRDCESTLQLQAKPVQSQDGVVRRREMPDYCASNNVSNS